MNRRSARRGLVTIVDDEVDITTYLRLALEDQGWEVSTVNEPSGAMETLRRRPPDVIILDLLMPQMTGLSLYGTITADPAFAHLPVVILSGLNAREDLPPLLTREGHALPPPSAFIEKPVNIREVIAVLNKLAPAAGGKEA